MNANAHFTLHREAGWLYRMAFFCFVLGGGILAGWYLGDGDDWFYSRGMVRYFVVPLCHVLLLISPVLAWSGLNNKLPVLMLTDTALLYRATAWSSNFKGVRRDRITSISIFDQKYNGTVISRLLQVHVDDHIKAVIGNPNSFGARINRTFYGATIVIPTAGWPLAPEDVKATIDAWVAEVHR